MDDENVETFDRDTVLVMLSDGLGKLKEKIDSGRIRDEKKEKVKINQYRSFIYGCLTFNTILKDKQIDVMMKDIKAIKEAVNSEIVSEPNELSKEDLEVVENTLAKIEES